MHDLNEFAWIFDARGMGNSQNDTWLEIMEKRRGMDTDQRFANPFERTDSLFK